MTPEEFTRAALPRVLANKTFNKIFCVGFNKTGTTTLESVLRLYGYSLPNQHQQEIRLTKSAFSTDYRELFAFCSQYDAFQDLPFSQGLTYVAADALFPDSKFILTERHPDEWFQSMCRFHQKTFAIDDVTNMTEQALLEKASYLYPGYTHENKKRILSAFDGTDQKVLWDKLYDYEFYTSMYLRRNEEIKRYFLNAPQKLLIIDITLEETTEKVCQFLNIPSDLIVKMPHQNKT